MGSRKFLYIPKSRSRLLRAIFLRLLELPENVFQRTARTGFLPGMSRRQERRLWRRNIRPI
jgi:hypothetical protein